MGRPKGSVNKPKHEQTEVKMEQQELILPTVPSERTKVIVNPTQREKEMMEDLEMVRGTFIYRAKPGGVYRSALRKYKKMAAFPNATGVYKVNMTDRVQYIVPRWVANWLNGEDELSCCDWQHDARNINLEEEVRGRPTRVPVFQFIIQEKVA